GRHLRPRRRDLDVLLLEVDLPTLAGDGGGAQIPLHFVEVMPSFASEEARNGHAARGDRTITLSAAWRGSELLLLQSISVARVRLRNHWVLPRSFRQPPSSPQARFPGRLRPKKGQHSIQGPVPGWPPPI